VRKEEVLICIILREILIRERTLPLFDRFILPLYDRVLVKVKYRPRLLADLKRDCILIAYGFGGGTDCHP